MSARTEPFVTTDEDMAIGFVAVDEFAPTAEAALAALLKACHDEWHMVWDADGPPTADELHRRWFKPHPDDPTEELIECGADDPKRESEFWRVEFPDYAHDWEARPHA